MKITVLGPAHPYRGGLALIMQTMARIFKERGNEVDVVTFKRQYPEFLFPGKSQTVTTPAPEGMSIVRWVDTVNPLNWIRIGRRLKRLRPDFILMKYWTPFMAPCFGTIARIARSNGHTKVLCQIDNVEPHEHHIIDRPCNRYYLRSVDGFVYMSEQVNRELKAYTSATAIYSPHPMFENFGDRRDRAESCRRLGLDAGCRYLMFFGLVREYKGLDMLLDAWGKLRNAGRIPDDVKLIIAGEFYASKDPYLAQMARLNIEEDILLFDEFIADEQVGDFFSIADAVVLPYRTATQSGVTQIAYKFDVPMVVTSVGGLPEIVTDGKAGIVCQADVDSIAHAVERLFDREQIEHFRRGVVEEKSRFSWEQMCNRLEELYKMVGAEQTSK